MCLNMYERSFNSYWLIQPKLFNIRSFTFAHSSEIDAHYSILCLTHIFFLFFYENHLQKRAIKLFTKMKKFSKKI